SAGPIEFGGSVTTTGAQTYNGSVSVTAPSNVSFTTSGAAIELGGTLSATGNGIGVTLDAGAGTISLGGDVSLLDGGLVLSSATTLTAPVGMTTGAGEIQAGAVTAADQNLSITNSGGATFASIDLGAGELILDGVT